MGFGAPVAVGVGVGVLADGLAVGVCDGVELVEGLVEPVGDAVFPGVELSGLHPTRAPRPRPAEAYSSCRLVTTLSIVPGVPMCVPRCTCAPGSLGPRCVRRAESRRELCSLRSLG